MRTLFKGGTVVSGQGTRPADVLVEGETISAVGMDLSGMKKMLCIEAAIVAGRPVFLGLLITVPVTAFMVSASQLETGVFLEEAPFLPVAIYALAIILSVALAYWLGARRLLGSDLSGPLKDDTLN